MWNEIQPRLFNPNKILVLWQAMVMFILCNFGPSIIRAHLHIGLNFGDGLNQSLRVRQSFSDILQLI